MSRAQVQVRTRVRLTAAGGLLALAGALALAGCGAGQAAGTAQQLPSVPGVQADDAGIAVRNAALVFDPEGYAPGDTAPVTLTVVNETDAPVDLVAASSSAAVSVTVGDEDGTELEIPAFGMASTTLQLTGLTTTVDAAGSVPVELEFSNQAAISLRVPVAPPLERHGEREPLDHSTEDHT